MGKTHDIEIDSIEQEVVFEEDDKGKILVKFIMKSLEDKENGKTHTE